MCLSAYSAVTVMQPDAWLQRLPDTTLRPDVLVDQVLTLIAA